MGFYIERNSTFAGIELVSSFIPKTFFILLYTIRTISILI